MNANTPQGDTCGTVRSQLALLLYAELSFDEEERVEAHLDECAECRAALERERAILAAADQVAVEPSPALLMQCREGLAERLKAEPARYAAGPAATGWFHRVAEWFAPRMPAALSQAWMRPAGALALLAMGFVGARLAPNLGAGAFGEASLVPGAARVSYVEPGDNGQVRIVLDETRQRVVTGRLEDESIRAYLLAATRDPSDAGLRIDTLELLNGRAQAADVRDALVYAVRNDENAGVRLKAMDGLRAFVHEPDVRGALAVVLEQDSNAGIRTQAIDMLIEGLADSSGNPAMDRRMIQVFQELMSRENNPYVRQQCQRALELAGASTEIY
jgi:hypothetical protein